MKQPPFQKNPEKSNLRSKITADYALFAFPDRMLSVMLAQE
jgi:hypothetical protein